MSTSASRKAGASGRSCGSFQPWGSERKNWTRSAPRSPAAASGSVGSTCAPIRMPESLRRPTDKTLDDPTTEEGYGPDQKTRRDPFDQPLVTPIGPAGSQGSMQHRPLKSTHLDGDLVSTANGSPRGDRRRGSAGRGPDRGRRPGVRGAERRT